MGIDTKEASINIARNFENVNHLGQTRMTQIACFSTDLSVNVITSIQEASKYLKGQCIGNKI